MASDQEIKAEVHDETNLYFFGEYRNLSDGTRCVKMENKDATVQTHCSCITNTVINYIYFFTRALLPDSGRSYICFVWNIIAQTFR